MRRRIWTAGNARSVDLLVRIMVEVAAGVPGDVRRQAHKDPCHRSQDSTRRCEIGGIGFFSIRNRKKKQFDYDEIATAFPLHAGNPPSLLVVR